MYCQKYDETIPVVSRRLSPESEVALTPKQFAQPVDIEMSLTHGERSLPNMPGYPRRSVDAALSYIHATTKSGLTKYLVRLVDGGDQVKDTHFSTCLDRINRQAQVIRLLTAAFPGLSFYIDPFGLALGHDDQWGVTDGNNGELSLALTERMFKQAVEAYSEAGASYVLTLGRFPSEVEVARQTLDSLNSKTKICTFSTNTETSQAYAYLQQQEAYRDSQQKVLPQNVGEMILWALCDIAAGADMIIIKPSDNFHVLLRLIQLASCGKSRRKFLDLPLIKELTGKSEFISKHEEKLRTNESLNVEWGSYAISGVYAQDMIVEQRKGRQFLLTLLFERFVSIASTAGICGQEVTIFDRNAHVYLAAE